MSIDWEPLVQVAIDVRQRAYAPYSEFLVGAALLASSGRIYSGCNVENASYGLSLCAERNAIAQAVAAGDREFLAMVICGTGAITPCGACRQCLLEFSPQLPILCCHPTDPTQRHLTSLPALLPAPFTP
ncbi:MAG TPA: cytidine deaminase [Pirellulaceae bacterium]|nr:cytidine deaminase [Pirellulaceae bacterium]